MAKKHCPECGRCMISISWSGLRTHEECKQKSYQARSKKLATLDNKRNYFAGTVTDRVVRKWLSDSPASNPGIMPDMVSSVIDFEREELVKSGEGVIRWKDSEDRSRVEAECREAVTLIEPDLMRYVVPFEYQPDFAFKAPIALPNPKTRALETITLHGYMDILVRDDQQNWWVWDVKHTKDNSYWRKTVGQLGFYDLAIELQMGKPTIQTGLMQPLCKQRIKPYTPSAQSRAELLQRISKMARDIWMEDHTPIQGSPGTCTYCPVRHACVKFEPVIDPRGRRRASL